LWTVLRAGATGWALAAILALCAGHTKFVHAQAAGKKIYDEEPYDLITLDAERKNEVIKVRLIEFPNRRVPENPKPSDKLRVKKFDDDQFYDIQWHFIERIDLFEQLVLAEANQLVEAGKLDEAYEYFVRLRKHWPYTEGLQPSLERYLFRCVVEDYKAGTFDRALAVAEELYSHNASFKEKENSPPLLDLIGQIADKIIAGYVEKKDFRSAKTLLKRLETKYSARNAAFARTWRANLAEIAAAHRDRSREHLAASRFVEAYDECALMMDVWPDVEGGAELAAEIARRYPLVIVGVAQPALVHDPRSLADPGARRTGRLVERRLMEFNGTGPEGGVYVCSLGSATLSDDRRRMTFTIRPQQATAQAAPVTGYEVARHLLELADPASPQYQPAWSRLLDKVELYRVNQVYADLKLPHVLPEAFLQTSYAAVPNVGQPGVKGSGPYFVLQKDEKTVRFTQNDRSTLFTPGQPAEIMERFYDDPQRAILALQRGEVDVLDQVFPGDVPALRTSDQIAIGRYAVPTIHLLTVVRRHPYLTNRTFRRALVYGANREAILSQGLLKGEEHRGYQVISAPFPAPVDASDSSAYGYDQNIPPRPYDPQLALILKVLATNELKGQYEKQHKPVPPLSPLVLGHPNDEVSRITCRALAAQWNAIGIPTRLIEFPAGVVSDLKGECDLVYTQAATFEPVVDAGRLFSAGGLSPAESTYVSLMLRRIESSKDWVEARQALRDLHRQVHEDVTVIPLFQTFDYYAFRRSIQGMRDGQVSLYQTVDQWRVAPRLAAK
jgi:ABC-type transport system substrate-binding protein